MAIRHPMGLTIVVVVDTLESRVIGRYLLAAVSDTMTIVGAAADGEEALALVLHSSGRAAEGMTFHRRRQDVDRSSKRR